MDSRDEQIYDTITINKISLDKKLSLQHIRHDERVCGRWETARKTMFWTKISKFPLVIYYNIRMVCYFILMPIDLTFKGLEILSITSVVDFKLGTRSWEWGKKSF